MAVGRSGLSPIMVGRSWHLTLLRGIIDAAEACPEGPTVALVSGEAGIGKSRLMRELLDELPKPHRALVAAALPDTLTRPLSLARELVDPATPDAGLVDALISAASEAPTTIVLEDLHWADADSVGAIERFLMGAPRWTTVVATYRNEDLSRRSPGGDLVARIERRHTCERVHLDRLTRAETASFLANILGTVPSSALLETLHNRTGGNPFFLEELVSTVGTDDLSSGSLSSSALPWSLEETVVQAMDGVTDRQRRIVEAAAVCGAATSFDTIAAVTETDEATLIEELRALVERGILVERRGDEFGFRHELVRDAVSATLLGRQRRRLHERILTVLREAAEPAASLAIHARGAERYDEFVELAREGARSYLSGGSSFAALRLASDALAEEPDDLALLATATEAGWLVGMYEEAEATASHWLACAVATGDRVSEYDARRLQMRLAFEQCDAARVDAMLAVYIDGMDGLDDPRARARALVTVAQNHMLQGRHDEAVEWADRALALADRIGAKEIAVQAAIERTSARSYTGGRAVVDDMIRAVDQAEALGQWVLVARGLNNLFDVAPPHTVLGRQLMERFRYAGERAGFDSMENTSLRLREVALAVGEGDLGAAQRGLARINELAGYGGVSRNSSKVWFNLLVATEEGRVADAERHRADLVEPRSSQHIYPAHLADLLVAACSDSPEEFSAPEHVRALAQSPDPLPLGEAVLAVDAALRAGVAPAFVRAVLCDGWLEAVPEWAAIEDVVDGLIRAADGDATGASRAFGQALSPGDEAIPRYLVGHLRVIAAEAALANGDRAGALTWVEAALDDLRRWPGWRRDRAEALHRRITGSGASPEGALTAREREVAILLADGLTNGQLAERLYISPKTAAVHVSNILMKLQMANRAEVAAWAVRTGLATAA